MRTPVAFRRAIARATPAVPEDLWLFVRSLRSLRGSGPVIGCPAFQRVLVLCPHPDDESLGCAGTIATLADGGAEVTVLTATDGEATKGARVAPAETARRRRSEGDRAAAILGATPRHLGLPDGQLAERQDELRDALRSVISELAPEAVFAPWLLDGHPDHRALAATLATVLIEAENDDELQIWGYETWTPLLPNRVVDITSVIERKRAALQAHETAALAFDLSAGEGLSRWRTMPSLRGRGWAEAFLAMSVRQYRELAAELQAR
jgi:LmbE family N-acetylglucosaminyl deacetylase